MDHLDLVFPSKDTPNAIIILNVTRDDYILKEGFDDIINLEISDCHQIRELCIHLMRLSTDDKIDQVLIDLPNFSYILNRPIWIELASRLFDFIVSIDFGIRPKITLN